MNVIHPPFVNFVIALPFVALFSQLTYMFTKDIAYSKAALRIIGFALLVSLFAVFSGLGDAEKVINGHMILQDGVQAISAHKTFGLLVVAILLLTTLAKWFAISKKSSLLENISIVLIIAVLMASLYQGRSGGSIVYKYSGGIDNRIIKQRMDEQKEGKAE